MSTIATTFESCHFDISVYDYEDAFHVMATAFNRAITYGANFKKYNFPSERHYYNFVKDVEASVKNNKVKLASPAYYSPFDPASLLFKYTSGKHDYTLELRIIDSRPAAEVIEQYKLATQIKEHVVKHDNIYESFAEAAEKAAEYAEKYTDAAEQAAEFSADSRESLHERIRLVERLATANQHIAVLLKEQKKLREELELAKENEFPDCLMTRVAFKKPVVEKPDESVEKPDESANVFRCGTCE